MKHFGTIIIRKSTISKICTALVFTAIIGTVCVTSLRNTECVEVFSGNDSELSKEILERGLPVEGKKKYISELMSNILGFDITKPTSIISKSLGTDQTTYSQNYNTDEIYNIIDSDSTFDNDVDTTTAVNICCNTEL